MGNGMGSIVRGRPFLMLLGAAVVIALVAGVVVVPRWGSPVAAQAPVTPTPPSGQGAAIPVQVAPVQTGPIQQTTTLTGDFQSADRVQIVARVSYDTDLNRALAAVREALDRNPRVLQEPAPLIKVTQLGASAVNIGVQPWVRVPDYVAAAGEINKAIVETFRGQGIVIPFPQHEVRLLNASNG